MYTKHQESALEKAEKTFEIVRSGTLKTPIKLKVGVLFDLEKYIEGSIAQMKIFEPLTLYWTTAYLRLYEIKKLMENKTQ